jgi:hypothetical protein
MYLEPLKTGLEENGWKDIQSGCHLGIEFDLIGHRRFIAKWNILVKRIPLLDERALGIWRTNFMSLSNQSKSLLVGRCFLLCLFADDISPQLSGMLSGDSFGFMGMFRMKGGGGNVLVGNIRNGGVYGEVPSLPMDLHKFSKEAKEIMLRLVGPARMPPHSLPVPSEAGTPPLSGSGPPPLPGSGPPPLPGSGPPPLT